ncbi:unnamed protein product [Phaeothamnion confervicola]
MPSFGYFTMTVHEARGLPQPSGILIRKLDPFVVIVIDNSPMLGKDPEEKKLTLERKTATATTPTWEETHVFRCNRGWYCRLECRDEGFISHDLLGSCEFFVGDTKDGWYPLMDEEGEAAGELRLSLDFRRDRGSMQTAAEALAGQVASYRGGRGGGGFGDGDGGQVVAAAVADELRRIVRENRGKLTQETEDALLKTCDVFERGLKSVTFVEDVARKMRELDPAFAADDRGRSENGGSSCECLLEFDELRAGLTDMVKTDWRGLPGAPPMTEALLDKQFRMYDTDGVGRCGPSALARFLSVVMIWGAQQCVAFSRLTLETDVGTAELAALFRRWEPHDPDLSGSIDAGRLREVLEDMGEAYSEEEMALVLREVDPAGSSVAHFPEFVTWWAS